MGCDELAAARREGIDACIALLLSRTETLELAPEQPGGEVLKVFSDEARALGRWLQELFRPEGRG